MKLTKEQFIENTDDVWTDDNTKPGVATEEEAKEIAMGEYGYTFK